MLNAAVAGPANWTVRDSDTRIHLFGTLHMMPESLDWLEEEVVKRLHQSKRLYLELPAEEPNPQEAMALIARLGMLEEGKRLEDVLDPELYGNLKTYLRENGLPVEGMAGVRPWLIGMNLTVMEMQKLGLDPEAGSEKIFLELARESGLPVEGLETVEYQLGIFAGLDPESEQVFLAGALESIDLLDTVAPEMVNNWSKGDTEKLDELLNSEFEDFPELAEALLYRRNRNWVGKIKELMAEPGTFFIAVGAGHLVGDKGVPALLRAEGLTVTRNP